MSVSCSQPFGGSPAALQMKFKLLSLVHQAVYSAASPSAHSQPPPPLWVHLPPRPGCLSAGPLSQPGLQVHPSTVGCGKASLSTALRPSHSPQSTPTTYFSGPHLPILPAASALDCEPAKSGNCPSFDSVPQDLAGGLALSECSRVLGLL